MTLWMLRDLGQEPNLLRMALLILLGVRVIRFYPHAAVCATCTTCLPSLVSHAQNGIVHGTWHWRNDIHFIIDITHC